MRQRVFWAGARVLALCVLLLALTLQLGHALAAEEPIKLLGTIPMTGEAGNLGPAYDRAIRLAVNDINEQGIKGFSKIEYKLIDTETKPSVMERKLMREIEMWKPDIAGGSALETTIRVLCEGGVRYQLPMFVGGHLGTAKYVPPGEVPVSKWVSYYGYAEFFAGWAAGEFFHELGLKKVALVAGDYDWGYGCGIGMKAYWEKHGKPFEIDPVIYTPLDKTDFSTEVSVLKATKPDGLFCPYMGAGWFSFPTQLRDANAQPEVFLYCPTYSNLGGAMITGEYGAENVYTLADHDPTSQEWVDFVKKWKAAYGERAFPEAYTNNYYQLVWWIKTVFEKAGTKDPDKIIETMRTTSFQNVCISPMGPVCDYGSNKGAKGAIVKFVPGASPIHPTFGLHEELVKVFTTPAMDLVEVLDTMKNISKL